MALDTQNLIWGGVRNLSGDTTERPELVQRSRWLLSQMERAGDRIVIPTIVAAELAVPVAAKKRGDFMEALSENFMVKPFDLPAAAIAADLFARAIALPNVRRAARSVISADVKIIATAIAAGATLFYRHDKKCRDLANLMMTAKDLPTHAEELFDDVSPSSD